MSPESQRRAARAQVATYHESQLGELLGHVEEAIGQFRASELDVFETDHVMFQYSRAAKELWKFCNLGDPEMVAGLIRDRPSVDWWELGAPKEH